MSATRLAPPGRKDGSLGITDEEFDHDRAGVLARLRAQGDTDRDRSAALSAEREVTDEAILGLSRELADEYHVRPDLIHALAHDAHGRSGLGHSEG